LDNRAIKFAIHGRIGQPTTESITKN